jgi:predicted aldo/keto reductase-like oxidoreductase
MIYREIDRTGERVSQSAWVVTTLGDSETRTRASRLLRTAIDRGIIWDYNGGISEVWMGQVLRDGYRRKVFLMTKIDGWDKNTAARQIEQSLGAC